MLLFSTPFYIFLLLEQGKMLKIPGANQRVHLHLFHERTVLA